MTDEETFKYWDLEGGERIGDCWIGFWKVMFGWRVRAGWMNNDWNCHADVCCGNDSTLLTYVRVVYSFKMTDNIKKGLDPFDGLKRLSDPKPCDKDEDFMEHCRAILSEVENEEV